MEKQILSLTLQNCCNKVDFKNLETETTEAFNKAMICYFLFFAQLQQNVQIRRLILFLTTENESIEIGRPTFNKILLQNLWTKALVTASKVKRSC